MKWRLVTNDNDILRDGDQFCLWQDDQDWSYWMPIQLSIGLALRDFAVAQANKFHWNPDIDPLRLVRVRRPVGDEQ